MKTPRLLALFIASAFIYGQCRADTNITLQVLYAFTGNGDGIGPNGGLVFVQGSDGCFYGTSYAGGTSAALQNGDPGKGTIYKITPQGTLTTLYSFNGGDGSYPLAGLVYGNDGYFYGTTSAGGTNNSCSQGCGTVFKISSSGELTTLHNFAGGDEGSNLRAGLVLGSDGSFYGNTGGTVFKITSAGTLTTLNPTYGDRGVIQGFDGNFYGISSGGGTSNIGSVYQITPDGTFTLLHSFTGPDGLSPLAPLVQGSDSNFYGTTWGGGTGNEGTVFQISSTGAFTTLHNFSGPDGSEPQTALTQGSDGNFYGTASYGGSAYQGFHTGSGTLFQISPAGTFTTLYYMGGSAGTQPQGGLSQGVDGNFYGATQAGGSNGLGIIFMLSVPLSTPANQVTALAPSSAGGAGNALARANAISSAASPPPNLSGFAISVGSVAGASYQLQYRDSLTSGDWSNLVGVSQIGAGGPLTLIDSTAASRSQRFYRVMVSGRGAITLPQASDIAIDPGYNNGWIGGSSGGRGLGPWTLTASGVSGSNSNGFFLGSSINNAFGTGPGIDTGGKSWGIYANSTNFTAAYRGFSNSVPVGGTVKLDMRNGLIDAHNADGFVLRTGNVNDSYTNYNTNARFEFLYIGGDSSNSYKVVDATGLYNIGVPFTGTGLHLIFTLNTVDTYTLLVIDNASGNTNATVNGTLGGTTGATLDSLALYNRNAGATSTNDAFFNSLQIIGP